jgi:hypothetical protein
LTAPIPRGGFRCGKVEAHEATRPAALNIHRQTSKFIHAVDAGFTAAT